MQVELKYAHYKKISEAITYQTITMTHFIGN
jgi:hypothetical protein